MNGQRRCLIAFGGNVGPVAAHFCRALDAFAAHGLQALACSRLYRTPALLRPQAPPQADYLNACCLVTTARTPWQVLKVLQALERMAGVRSPVVWAPRALDLDLIDYENFLHTAGELSVPHPQAAGRAFVLQPLCDVAPDWCLGGTQRPVKELLRDLDAASPRACAHALSWTSAAMAGRS